MDRKRLGLFAVGFVLVVGLLEVMAVKLGSMDIPLPTGEQQPTVAESRSQD
ncbi:hypothetical protein ACN3XK_11315 [Actinomadura welshii]